MVEDFCRSLRTCAPSVATAGGLKIPEGAGGIDDSQGAKRLGSRASALIVQEKCLPEKQPLTEIRGGRDLSKRPNPKREKAGPHPPPLPPATVCSVSAGRGWSARHGERKPRRAEDSTPGYLD